MAFKFPSTLGVYEQVAMLFDLKNASATYKRPKNAIFHDLINKSMKLYMDDVVLKSRDIDQYLSNLE